MIRNERLAYVASHVTPEVKAALKVEAEKQHTTVSRLVYKLLRDQLRALGHKL